MSKKWWWIFIVLVVSLYVSACHTTILKQAHTSDDVNMLRRYVQENPKKRMSMEVRKKIAKLEYEAALQSNTYYAYNTFLEQYPTSSYVVDIRRRLEAMDFAQAQAEGTEQAFSAFLLNYPSGRYADEAREILDKIVCTRWEAEDDLNALVQFVSIHADISCRRELDAQIKKLWYQNTMSNPTVRNLVEFIEAYPNDELTLDVRHRLLVLQVNALLSAGLFEQARERVETSAGVDEVQKLLARVETAHQKWRESGFDEKRLVHATNYCPENHENLHQLKTWLHQNNRIARQFQKARALLLSDMFSGKSPPKHALFTSPIDQWFQISELLHTPSEQSADFLLNAISNKFLETRYLALCSLRKLINQLGEVRSQVWLSQKHTRLAKKARSGILLFQLAVVCDLMDEHEQAFLLLEQVLAQGGSRDLFVLYIAVDLAIRVGRTPEAASLASRFSSMAQSFARLRTDSWYGEPELKESDQGALILRQLCGLITLWEKIIAFFEKDPTSSYTSVLVPWLKKAKKDLDELKTWYVDEESCFARSHPNYIGCKRIIELFDEEKVGLEEEMSALLTLIMGAEIIARPIIKWVICCHPNDEIQLAAKTLEFNIRLAHALPAFVTEGN